MFWLLIHQLRRPWTFSSGSDDKLVSFARHAATAGRVRATHGVSAKKPHRASVVTTLERTGSSFRQPGIAQRCISTACVQGYLHQHVVAACTQRTVHLCLLDRHKTLTSPKHYTAPLCNRCGQQTRSPRSAGAAPPPRATQHQHHDETRPSDADAAAPPARLGRARGQAGGRTKTPQGRRRRGQRRW